MLDPNLPTLALDCSVKKITLALIRDGKICAGYNDLPVDSQSKTILKVIDDVLKKTGIKISDIKNVLFCHGPGSFTSLRVGLATLVGLFQGRDVQVACASSLLFRCYSVHRGESPNVVSTVTLGRKRLAIGVLKPVSGEFREQVVADDEIEGFFKGLTGQALITGPGAVQVRETISADSVVFKDDDITELEAFLSLISENHCDIMRLSQVRVRYMLDPDIG